MDKLEKKLHSDLLRNPAVELKKSLVWHLPVTTYSVAFSRVKRSKMDILMKMMLLTFDQTEIRRAANLSELLLVEELFIEDLLGKMQRMGLVRLEKGIFQLTSKGQEQLKSGIMEEELEEETTELTYSPAHDEVWPDGIEPLPDRGEELAYYRYVSHENLNDKEAILHVLAERESTVEEDGFQTVVKDINSFEQESTEHVPCLEFHLYNKEQDTFYARVWNTGLSRWDETLEKQIEEKERVEWRGTYKMAES